MTRPKTLLFDFGNVLIDIDIPGARDRIARLKHPDIPFADYESAVLELIRKFEVDAISEGVFINGILRMAARNVQARDVVSAWNSMLIGIPDYRLGMLEMLRDRYSVYLLSNINSLHLDWVHHHLRASHGVTDFEDRFFDGVFYSHLIRLRKPDRVCFERVVEETFLDPATTLFIDDTPENLETAEAMGFQTLLSPPEDEVAETLKLRGLY